MPGNTQSCSVMLPDQNTEWKYSMHAEILHASQQQAMGPNTAIAKKTFTMHDHVNNTR